jgi:hypothetical protein
MTENKNIPPLPNGIPDEEVVLRYLGNEIPNEEQQAFEASIEGDPFLEDAVEGLQEINQPGQIPLLLNDLRLNLNQQLNKKKLRKEKRKLKDQPILIIAIIMILAILILGYFMVRF